MNCFHFLAIVNTAAGLVYCGCCNKWPKTWWLKTRIYCLIVLEIRFGNQGVDRAVFPLEAPGGIPFLASSSCWLLAVFDLRSRHSSVCLHLIALSLVSVTTPSVSLGSICVVTFKAHPDSLGEAAPLKILNLISSFANKVTCTRSRDLMWVSLGEPFSSYEHWRTHMYGFISLCRYLGMQLLGCMVNGCLTFWEIAVLF